MAAVRGRPPQRCTRGGTRASPSHAATLEPRRRGRTVRPKKFANRAVSTFPLILHRSVAVKQGPWAERRTARFVCMASTMNVSPAFQPLPPHNIEDSGLGQSLLLDLVLRHAFFEGLVTLRTLVHRTKLSLQIVHNVFRHMQREQMCEARATAGDDYELTLSAK